MSSKPERIEITEPQATFTQSGTEEVSVGNSARDVAPTKSNPANPRNCNYIGFWNVSGTVISTDFHRFSAPVFAACVRD